MKNKTKLGIYSVAGIVAIAAIASGLMFDQTQNQVDVLLKSNQSYPHEIPHWQGVPTLAMNPSPSDRTDFHELKGTEFTWLQRLVENRETIVHNKELKEFFEYSEDVYLYKINGQLYTIHYTVNPSIRLDEHYVKVFQSDEISSDSRTVSSEHHTWLQRAISDPYDWILISETELNDYKSFVNSSQDITINNTGYHLRYLGADLAELENQEFNDTYNKSIGIFEEITQ